MRARKITMLFLGFLGLMLATWIAVGQTRRVDDLALKNAGKTGEEWLTYGLTPGETRYSPLKQIDTTNVSRLGLSWSFDIGSWRRQPGSNAAFWNGIIYAITNWSVVFAVDARTGKERWRWDPEVNQTAVRPKICCGVVNRGLAIYQNKIIAPVIDGRLEALDAETGKAVWEARVAFPQDNYTITMAPRIAKGKVIIGVSGAEYPIRGFFSAFDANTGALAWRFYTVPGDPSKPFENPAMKKAAETWSGDWWKFGGGGTVWDGMAYDPDTNLVYVGTGNGGAVARRTAEVEGQRQPLRLLDSGRQCRHRRIEVALPKHAGRFVGLRQRARLHSRRPHDQRPRAQSDHAGEQERLLLRSRSRDRRIHLGATLGHCHLGQRDRPGNRPAHHQSGSPLRLRRGNSDCAARRRRRPQLVADVLQPDYRFGLYPIIDDSNTTFTVDPNFTYVPGRSNTGRLRGDSGATPKTLPAIGPTAPEGQRGMLCGMGSHHSKRTMENPGGGSIGGGTVTTAGNLVLQVINDGRLMAYSADKGEKLFEVQTGLRGGMGPPITFMLDGKQHVALMGGLGQVVAAPAGGGAAAGARGAEPVPPDIAGAAAQAQAGQRANAPAPAPAQTRRQPIRRRSHDYWCSRWTAKERFRFRIRDFEIGQILHLRSEIRNRKLNFAECNPQFRISGFEVQNLSNLQSVQKCITASYSHKLNSATIHSRLRNTHKRRKAWDTTICSFTTTFSARIPTASAN